VWSPVQHFKAFVAKAVFWDLGFFAENQIKTHLFLKKLEYISLYLT
jgi:hypothetical protein